MLRPVVTIKVFFVKENFDKVFDETLIVTTVKEIFDQKLWWNRTPSYFSSNFDGLWWKTTNQDTVLERWDDVYKTKAHANKKAGKGKSARWVKN